ncbi:hypothetical protein Gekk315_00048 [Aeromonas phage Gekk3-15]
MPKKCTSNNHCAKIKKFTMFKRKPMIGKIGKSIADWIAATPETSPSSFDIVKLCVLDGILYGVAPNRMWEQVALGEYIGEDGEAVPHTVETFLASVGAKPALFTGSPKALIASQQRFAAGKGRNIPSLKNKLPAHK